MRYPRAPFRWIFTGTTVPTAAVYHSLSRISERTALRCDNVKFGRVDVEAERELAKRYGIFAIPTLIPFRDGEEVKRSVGAVPEEKLADLIKS